MWREESGFLEMFLAYYGQFEENVTEKKAYRDFLYDVLCLHERSVTFNLLGTETEPDAEVKLETRPQTVIEVEPREISVFTLSDAVSQLQANLTDHSFAVENQLEESLPESSLERANASAGWASSSVVKRECEMEETSVELGHVIPRFPTMDNPEMALRWDMIPSSVTDFNHPVSVGNANETDEHEAEENLSGPACAATNPFKCDHCGKCFSRKTHLLLHERIHTTTLAYVCHICNESYAREKDLITHRRLHTGEKPHSCRICKRGFTSPSYLKVHMRIHTGERPYVCQFCNRSFTRAHDVVRHKSIHTGERPYTCKFCNKGFYHKSNLKSHMYVHTGEHPFACRLCDQSFTQKSKLLAHEVTHLKS